MTRIPALTDRAAGVLLHITSLPGAAPVGELGAEAYAFADFLARAGQRWWQVLPLHPPAAGDSPYSADSIMAGNPLLIGLAPLVEAGWLTEAEAEPPARRQADACDYPAARRFKTSRLRRAHARFQRTASARDRNTFAAFRKHQAGWLEDYALFKALKEHMGGAPWFEWPVSLRARRAPAVARCRAELKEGMDYHAFVQWQFHRQWLALRRHCERLGIALMGDVPMYPDLDSADVWVHQKLFKMDAQGRCRVVAGVPPDDYSATGQLWGNPVYRWDAMHRLGYPLWSQRIRGALEHVHALRLDHFIGFVRYWEVPAGAKDARGGRFRKGPGLTFFRAMERTLGELPFVAEDLGLVVPPVTALREQLGLPGMRVLQFGLGDPEGGSDNLPHRFPEACAAYTGTHDNETSLGWWQRLRAAEHNHHRGPRKAAAIRDYLGADAADLPWAMIRLVYQSPARLAFVPAQDLLGLDNGARMNRPGISRGNWRWRLTPGALDDALAARLAGLAAATGRAPRRRA